ncbi:MAG: deoxyribonuclease IV [Euryarchaeota archaeon]|nr:deoxyribonuclease IV [Euryarchaeota archaeon]
MVIVGAHVSIAGSIDKAVERAQALGCDTFQIFTRNPRGWRYKELSEEVAEEFKRKVKSSGMISPVDHMPYLPNLASPKEETYRKSIDALAVELNRCGVLGISHLVTHLGSHLGAGKEVGFERIGEAVRNAFSRVENDVMILLETTADTKNSMGGSFQDLRRVMDVVDQEDRLGVCLDTCHVFAAGYELRTKTGLRETMDLFDQIIGLDRLRLVHLNDSRGGLGSRLDRHQHIGLGEIGEAGFEVILTDPEIRRRPLILETPVDETRDDKGNIRVVRELAGEGPR